MNIKTFYRFDTSTKAHRNYCNCIFTMFLYLFCDSYSYISSILTLTNDGKCPDSGDEIIQRSFSTECILKGKQGNTRQINTSLRLKLPTY